MAVITGTTGNDSLIGSGTDDTLTGLGGNDTLNGASGTDIAVYSGNLAGYRLGVMNGHVVIQDINLADGNDGTDQLSNIETLRFADRDISIGSEFRINTTTAGWQSSPSAGNLSDGGFVAAWQGEGGIYIQRFAANGMAMGGEQLISVKPTVLLSVSSPCVTCFDEGGFLVSWLTQANAQEAIIARRFDLNGVAVGNEFQVSSASSPVEHDPSVTALAGGGFVIVWHSPSDGANYTDYGGIVAQRYGADGSALGAAFRVNSTIAGEQRSPVCTALSTGGFVIAWTSSTDQGIYAQRYGSSGLAVGHEFLVNTTTGSEMEPSIAALSGGGFVVTWTTFYGADIYARRFDANGVAKGGEFRVNATEVFDQGDSVVAALEDGGFLIAWVSDYQDVPGTGIYAQRFDANGLAKGSEFRVNTYTLNGQYDPSIAALPDGGFVITWTSDQQDGSGNGVYAQRYNAAGNAVGSAAITGTQGDDYFDLLGAGALHASGLNGNDTYVVDGGGDVVVESAGGGTDTIVTSLNWTLGANLENLNQTGTAPIIGYGNGVSNRLTGNAANNVLYGLAGADTLSGGTGNDTLEGGTGQDTAIFTGKSGDYWFTATKDSLTITDLKGSDGNDGKDVLHNIETLHFADRDITAASTEFRVNTTTNQNQSYPSIATLSDGGYAIAWVSYGQDGDRNGIFAQRYAADGSLLGREFQVNTRNVNSQFQPSIAALAGGGFVVSWTSYADGDAYPDIFTQRYDAAGHALGGEYCITATVPNGCNESVVAALSDGGYVVAWNSYYQDGDQYGIYAERFDAGGVAQGGQFLVNTTISGSQQHAAIAVLASGDFLITWGGSTGQFYDESGATRGGQFHLATKTVSYAEKSSIAPLKGGGFVMVWSSAGIHAQCYDANGVRQGIEVKVNSTGEYVNPVSVTALTGGGYLVTWMSGQTIYARQFDEHGGPITSQFLVSSHGADYPYDYTPVASALDDGGYIITWTTVGQDGSDNGISAQRYDADGNPSIVRIIGTSGNDMLAYAGPMPMQAFGGAGDDTYTVSHVDDLILENPGQGTDTVETRISFVLGSNLENLTLTGAANIRGTGNELANVLRGNAGNNVLNGGSGADTLIGGDGNDSYYVDDAGDVIYESTDSVNGGVDAVYTSIDRTLGNYQENLVLTGSAATSAIGNSLANKLTGNAANNVLNGRGGADTMAGVLGNDSYFVDNAGDVIIESSDSLHGGTDIVYSGVSRTLGDYQEYLVLTGSVAINGSGNSLNNMLYGNGINNVLSGSAGNDVLDGKLGTDTLIGGAGSDSFVFDTTLSTANVDAIADFAQLSDKICIDDDVFTKFNAGIAVTTGQFYTAAGATTAHDIDDRLIYDTTTGALYYDADGIGAGSSAIMFAVLGTSTHPALSISNFVVVG